MMEDSGLVNDDEYMTEDSGPENDIDDETSHSTKLVSIDIIIIKPDTLIPITNSECRLSQVEEQLENPDVLLNGKLV